MCENVSAISEYVNSAREMEFVGGGKLMAYGSETPALESNSVRAEDCDMRMQDMRVACQIGFGDVRQQLRVEGELAMMLFFSCNDHLAFLGVFELWLCCIDKLVSGATAQVVKEQHMELAAAVKAELERLKDEHQGGGSPIVSVSEEVEEKVWKCISSAREELPPGCVEVDFSAGRLEFDSLLGCTCAPDCSWSGALKNLDEVPLLLEKYSGSSKAVCMMLGFVVFMHLSVFGAGASLVAFLLSLFK